MMITPEEVLGNNGYDIESLEEDGTVLFRNPDYVTAICGVTYNNEVVYDFEKMVEYLIKYEDMNYDEAIDFIYYNASFGMSGYKMPIIMYPIEHHEEC